MSDPDDISKLIAEIADKHGIVVGRNDPILVLQTINHRLLENSAKHHQEALEKFKEEMEEVTQRWSFDTKTKAERIINASLDAAKRTAQELSKDIALGAGREVKKELDEGLARFFAHSDEIKRTGTLNMMASIISFGAACILAITILVR